MSIISNSITSSLEGTSSYAATASYALALVNPVVGGAIISASSPGIQPSGTLWFNSTNNNLYVQTGSASGSQYVSTSASFATSASLAISASFATTASYLSGSVPTLIQAQNTSAQSISNGATDTITGWTNVLAQNASEWNATTGVFTATKAGTYLVSSNLTYATKSAGQSGNSSSILIYKNSIVLVRVVTPALNTAVIIRGLGTATAVVNLAVGDTITIRTTHDLGGSAILSTTTGHNSVSIQQIPARITV